MSDHSDERIRRCASAMRKAFFAEFGALENMSSHELSECMRTLMSIQAGEFIEGVARFKGPGIGLLDAARDVLNLFVGTNPEQFMELSGKDDVTEFLRGTIWE